MDQFGEFINQPCIFIKLLTYNLGTYISLRILGSPSVSHHMKHSSMRPIVHVTVGVCARAGSLTASCMTLSRRLQDCHRREGQRPVGSRTTLSPQSTLVWVRAEPHAPRNKKKWLFVSQYDVEHKTIEIYT